MREPGFYWVKHNEYKGWEIAFFDINKNWMFAGWGTSFYEEEILEIDERRIVRVIGKRISDLPTAQNTSIDDLYGH